MTIPKKPLAATLLTICLSYGFTGCATKGPREVYAFPRVNPEMVAPQQELLSPQRSRPGTIMDPESTTFAQVPKRILYLPGSQNIFGRTSPQQEVAYSLIPVDRLIPENNLPSQAATPPPKKEEPKATKEVFKTAFVDEDGGERHGTARRLGILGKSPVEKQRAELLLKEKETLEWSAEAGWVGFQEERKTRLVPKPANPLPIAPAKPKEEIPLPQVEPVQLTPKKSPPTEEKPKVEEPATTDFVPELSSEEPDPIGPLLETEDEDPFGQSLKTTPEVIDATPEKTSGDTETLLEVPTIEPNPAASEETDIQF